MRKMSIWKKGELDFSFFGLSTEKGIFMRAEKVEEGEEFAAFVSTQYPGVFATINNDGEVELNPAFRREVEYEVYIKEKMKIKRISKIRKIISILALISFLSSFLLVASNKSYLSSFMLAVSFILVGCAKITSVMYDYLKSLLGDKETIQCFKYHAAEHAVINAYYDLKRVPTLEEIKNYSSFSYRCGTARIFENAWVLLGVGICRFAPGIWYIPAVILFLLFSCWALKKKLYFTEIFSLSEPTDSEYNVAIKCLEAAVIKKNEIDEMFPKQFSEIFYKIFNSENFKMPIVEITIGDNPENMQ